MLRSDLSRRYWPFRKIQDHGKGHLPCRSLSVWMPLDSHIPFGQLPAALLFLDNNPKKWDKLRAHEDLLTPGICSFLGKNLNEISQQRFTQFMPRKTTLGLTLLLKWKDLLRNVRTFDRTCREGHSSRRWKILLTYARSPSHVGRDAGEIIWLGLVMLLRQMSTG